MPDLIHLFDHSYPKISNSRIEFLKSTLQSELVHVSVSDTRDDIKTKLLNATSPCLFLVHGSEFQFQDLEGCVANQNAFFIFYSGAGFQNPPTLPKTWRNQILCFSPSVDLKRDTDFTVLKQLISDFFQHPELSSWSELRNNSDLCDPSRFPLLCPVNQKHDLDSQTELMALHHNMKSLLFLLKKSETEDFSVRECISHWEEKFLLPLNALMQKRPFYGPSLQEATTSFDQWLKQKNPPLNISEGVQYLNHLRRQILKLTQNTSFPQNNFLDFNRVGRKTEIWVACFHETWVPQCESLLNHFEKSPHITRTLGPRQTERNIYLTYHELIEDLRAQKPEQLLDTYFILVCPGSIHSLLNCGHQQKDDEHWKVDPYSHMGLLSQIILEFPQLNTHTVYSLDDKASQIKAFHQELAVSVPNHVEQSEEILNRAFEHHFFDLHHDRTKLLNSVQYFLQGNRYLFDPTGMRTLLKLRLIANVFAGIDENGDLDLENTLEQRKVIASRLNHLCIAVDEDLNSATFHAYASYRYGWRAWTITTFTEFDHAHLWQGQAKHKLVIRDTDLRFPDIQAKEPYRNLFGNTNVRYRLECVHSDLWKYLPKGEQPSKKLDDQWNVRVITANQQQVTPLNKKFHTPEELNKGESYSTARKEFSPLKTPEHTLPFYLGIAKPFNSFYDLAQLWLDREKFPHMNQTLAARLKPPARLMSKAGHFAPYINLPLAEQLLHQVKRCDGQNENGWLLSAMLASEADELLLGMSEYSGLEAIRFLHRSEVMAEIESIGLSGRIKIDHRKEEINQLVETRYHNDISKQDQFLSRFWDDCRTLYKNSEQFQASEQANVESFSKRKWFHKSPWISRWEETARKGMILCASSLGAWSGFWVLSNAFFYLLYYLLLDHNNFSQLDFMYQVYISSLIGEPSFGFSDSLGPLTDAKLKLVVFLHFGCSYILFGFFLSMVYRRITRS
jgi:hypothetical protein